MLTIIEELGTIHGAVITCVGDLKFGRIVHSLCELLQNYADITIDLCSPSSLEMPSELVEQIRDRGQLDIVSAELTSEIVGDSDVMYCTRVQKERFSDLTLYAKVQDSLTVDARVI